MAGPSPRSGIWPEPASGELTSRAPMARFGSRAQPCGGLQHLHMPLRSLQVLPHGSEAREVAVARGAAVLTATEVGHERGHTADDEAQDATQDILAESRNAVVLAGEGEDYSVALVHRQGLRGASLLAVLWPLVLDEQGQSGTGDTDSDRLACAWLRLRQGQLVLAELALHLPLVAEPALVVALSAAPRREPVGLLWHPPGG
mmetsp:Transcript_26172/g.75477  ORF Transcript_26172/g.75477 Transcript_26172/m.75477 type:complete len:202 (-) Transcript_26172:94-699(-)